MTSRNTSRRRAVRRLFLSVALTGPLVLAACGGGGTEPAAAPNTGVVPAPVSALPPPSLPPAAATTVAACYDLAPAVGKTISLTRRWVQFDVGGLLAQSGELPQVSIVGVLVAFEGYMATETVSTFSPPNSPAYSSKEYALQTGPAELTEYGGVSELVTATVQSRSKTVFTPPLVTVLTTVPGESMASTVTMVTTSTVNGVDQPQLTSTVSTSGLFVGVEPVTIAAGTFNACRFELRHSGSQGPTSTRWILVGHGIELKSSTPAFGGIGAEAQELTTLLINGVVPK